MKEESHQHGKKNIISKQQEAQYTKRNCAMLLIRDGFDSSRSQSPYRAG
jgi:hypothetical protein